MPLPPRPIPPKSPVALHPQPKPIGPAKGGPPPHPVTKGLVAPSGTSRNIATLLKNEQAGGHTLQRHFTKQPSTQNPALANKGITKPQLADRLLTGRNPDGSVNKNLTKQSHVTSAANEASLSNLARAVGNKKVTAAIKRLEKSPPGTQVRPINIKLRPDRQVTTDVARKDPKSPGTVALSQQQSRKAEVRLQKTPTGVRVTTAFPKPPVPKKP